MQQFHDWMLALAVLVLVIIDVIIIGAYLAVEGIQGQLVVEKVLNRENPRDVIGVSWFSVACSVIETKEIKLPSFWQRNM